MCGEPLLNKAANKHQTKPKSLKRNRFSEAEVAAFVNPFVFHCFFDQPEPTVKPSATPRFGWFCPTAMTKGCEFS